MGLLGKLTSACRQYWNATWGHVLKRIPVHSEKSESLGTSHVTYTHMEVLDDPTIHFKEQKIQRCDTRFSAEQIFPLSTLTLMWKRLFSLAP